MSASTLPPVLRKLIELKKTLDSYPRNICAAHRYWDALGSVKGRDVRSGGFVIEAYRGCALASREGVVAIARAYRELFEKSGESPRPEVFDKELIEALKRQPPELPDNDQVTVQWVLTSIDQQMGKSRSEE